MSLITIGCSSPIAQMKRELLLWPVTEIGIGQLESPPFKPWTAFKASYRIRTLYIKVRVAM